MLICLLIYPAYAQNYSVREQSEPLILENLLPKRLDVINNLLRGFDDDVIYNYTIKKYFADTSYIPQFIYQDLKQNGVIFSGRLHLQFVQDGWITYSGNLYAVGTY
ncbi:hypothetical protein [Peptoniphilus mikwangii]|uniref:hypothetical protein n=1 Tax=Peptoniphilus mikwangii TaxID=1354300 RepID=UPI00055BC6DA|nr:hypothetical protein [Peptoniphilus mikwangii]